MRRSWPKSRRSTLTLGCDAPDHRLASNRLDGTGEVQWELHRAKIQAGTHEGRLVLGNGRRQAEGPAVVMATA